MGRLKEFLKKMLQDLVGEEPMIIFPFSDEPLKIEPCQKCGCTSFTYRKENNDEIIICDRCGRKTVGSSCLRY